jgi:hypothetical protein
MAQSIKAAGIPIDPVRCVEDSLKMPLMADLHPFPGSGGANDFASGTSGRSSKIIHGGLRYLKHLNFRLTWESCHERNLHVRLNSRLVQPWPFLIPIYRGRGESPAMLRAGYLEDPRLSKALDWLLKVQNIDGGWLCPYWKAHVNDKHSCFMGIIAPLDAFSENAKK